MHSKYTCRVTPCSQAHCTSFDYAQQVHLPSDPVQPGPLYFLWLCTASTSVEWPRAARPTVLPLIMHSKYICRVTPCSQAHCTSFDYAQQVHLPSDPMQPGPLYLLWLCTASTSADWPHAARPTVPPLIMHSKYICWVTPCSQAHCTSFDYAQQVHLSSDPVQPGPLYFLWLCTASTSAEWPHAARPTVPPLIMHSKYICRVTPCSQAHCTSFDYAQQVHLPSDPVQPGPLYFLWLCTASTSAEWPRAARPTVLPLIMHSKYICRVTPCSQAHCTSFDYAQQVHLPSDPVQPGPLYFLVPRKCVCCEGLPRQMNFLVDESHLISKGSNAVVSYMHYFFERFGLGETNVDLHCDNCSGQNKNRVMWYCAWRVATGLHRSITLKCLVVGHRQFFPDSCLGFSSVHSDGTLYHRCVSLRLWLMGVPVWIPRTWWALKTVRHMYPSATGRTICDRSTDLCQGSRRSNTSGIIKSSQRMPH